MSRAVRRVKWGSVKGFTLIELLVVLGLLAAFTYLSFRLLSGGLSIWRLADESRDQDERATVVLDMMRRDLGVADGSPRSRFVVDYGDVTVFGESHSRARLRFVRTVNRAEEARGRQGLVAQAGTESRGAAAPTVDTAAGPATAIPKTATDLDTGKPSIGLLEVAYMTVPEVNAKDRDGATFTLRRAAQFAELDESADSIFAKDYFEKVKGGFSERSAELAGGVLHFGLLLASHDTDSFDKPVGPAGPETAWDSTRFQFSGVKAVGLGRFSLASAVELPPRERVYPRRVRVMLILEREDPDRRRPRLARGLDATSMEISLDDPRPIAVSSDEYVKIGNEWIQLQGADRGVFRARVRGALGTRPAPHNIGLPIHRGRVFQAEFSLDCARDAATR